MEENKTKTFNTFSIVLICILLVVIIVETTLLVVQAVGNNKNINTNTTNTNTNTTNTVVPRRRVVDPYLTEDKPIIYIYPEEEMNVSVKLPLKDNITVSYPKYIDGWNVYAKVDGTLLEGATYGIYNNSDEKNIVGYAYLSKNNHIDILANEGEGYDREYQ